MRKESTHATWTSLPEAAEAAGREAATAAAAAAAARGAGRAAGGGGDHVELTQAEGGDETEGGVVAGADGAGSNEVVGTHVDVQDQQLPTPGDASIEPQHVRTLLSQTCRWVWYRHVDVRVQAEEQVGEWRA